jgi:peroxiredoxin Q/BCP
LQAKYKIAKIMLVIGDKMPTFSVVDQHGNTVTDQMLLGQKTIIYFYPKDSTPGCTAEACNLRDNYVRLQAEGYQVVGVSKDSVKSHVNFIAKNNLPFTLLSDPSTEMLQAFGAWGEKKMCGKTCIGTLRKTFVFDEQGTLVQRMDKVDTKNHAEQILV